MLIGDLFSIVANISEQIPFFLPAIKAAERIAVRSRLNFSFRPLMHENPLFFISKWDVIPENSWQLKILNGKH